MAAGFWVLMADLAIMLYFMGPPPSLQEQLGYVGSYAGAALGAWSAGKWTYNKPKASPRDIVRNTLIAMVLGLGIGGGLAKAVLSFGSGGG